MYTARFVILPPFSMNEQICQESGEITKLVILFVASPHIVLALVWSCVVCLLVFACLFVIRLVTTK